MASFRNRDDSSDSDDSEDDFEISAESYSEPPSKKPKIDGPQSGVYSGFASKMMEKMGYKAGKGLGKYGQGRADIVEASKHRGRRGLGLHLEGLEAASVSWEKEEISADEEVPWIKECQLDIPTVDEMKDWMVIGTKKLSIDDEDEYCHPAILDNVLKSKSVFDQLEPEELRRARTKSNPFETIRGGIFLNRAAMKMANMDAVLDFMFTNPVDEKGRSLVGQQELLYFADICAGPGGFSEYVLWRKKGDAKGFGFTLKGSNDFKLSEFFAGPSESFEPYYGEGGVDGDGDIFKPGNLNAFRKFVWENTDNKGVHFVMADGGFSVEGQENIQEILSKQLYLCQFLCAISILRPGGHFVCKLFDIFTPFSVGLIYLMYRIFKQVAIFKPITSRPANSERYIICKWLHPDAQPVMQYLYNINIKLNSFTSLSKDDVTEIVPEYIIKEDEEFYTYILDSNNSLGEVQVLNLAKIKAFTQDSDLYEDRQSEMKVECLKRWKVPDKVRTAPDKPEPQTKFRNILKDSNLDYFNHIPDILTPATLEGIKSIYDYRCMLAGSSKRWFLLSLGRTHIFKWDGRSNSRWQKLLTEELKLELPADTLLEAEMVQELRGEGKGQRKMTALHIIDVLILYGIDRRLEHFNLRHERARKFAKAVTKMSRPDLSPIRVKDVFRFEEVSKIFHQLDYKIVKGSGGRPTLCYLRDEGQYFLPHGVYFIKTVKDPWSMAFSRSQQKKYWYNMQTQESTFELPVDSVASVRSCMLNRLLWKWEEGVQVHDSQPPGLDNYVSKIDIEQFVQSRLPR